MAVDPAGSRAGGLSHEHDRSNCRRSPGWHHPRHHRRGWHRYRCKPRSPGCPAAGTLPDPRLGRILPPATVRPLILCYNNGEPVSSPIPHHSPHHGNHNIRGDRRADPPTTDPPTLGHRVQATTGPTPTFPRLDPATNRRPPRRQPHHGTPTAWRRLLNEASTDAPLPGGRVRRWAARCSA